MELFVNLSRYFIAKIPKQKTWFVSGCVRNLGHTALERSLDKQEGTFEFFVSPLFVTEFVELLEKLKNRGDLCDFYESPNRFLENQKQ